MLVEPAVCEDLDIHVTIFKNVLFIVIRIIIKVKENGSVSPDTMLNYSDNYRLAGAENVTCKQTLTYLRTLAASRHTIPRRSATVL